MTWAMFWILSIFMIVATVMALCWPLLRQTVSDEGAVDGNMAVYKDQLSEVEADLDRGLLSTEEAASARAEISRRLIALSERVDGNEASVGGEQAGWKTWAPIAVAIPLIALPLYLTQGKPGLQGVPYAERIAASPNGDNKVNTLIAKVEARLRTNPQDGRGWDVIAPVYFSRQQFRKSANAYSRSLQINGPTARRLMGLGESIVFANDEIVTEPARLAFEQAVKLEPGAIKARFWLALAKEQDGRIQEAIAGYKQLLSEGSSEDSWFNMLSNRVFALQRKASQKTSKTAPKLGPRISNAPQASQPGPTQEQVKAAQSMSEGDRMAMINTMVEGLAERLGDKSTDSAGWLRLIRSYAILNRRDDAQSALLKARSIFKDNASVQAQLTKLASGLNLTQ